MIKYNLQCNNKHEFESWFSNSKEFEKLRSKKMIECLYCKSTKINKSIMSPQVLNKEDKTEIENLKSTLYKNKKAPSPPRRTERGSPARESNPQSNRKIHTYPLKAPDPIVCAIMRQPLFLFLFFGHGRKDNLPLE